MAPPTEWVIDVSADAAQVAWSQTTDALVVIMVKDHSGESAIVDYEVSKALPAMTRHRVMALTQPDLGTGPLSLELIDGPGVYVFARQELVAHFDCEYLATTVQYEEIAEEIDLLYRRHFID